ncbi:dTMP kinase [Anaerobacillus sp. MEB173]|uniref:dTMP kinase n=1 Tax=Anaerobacillus sp. MEB173 TaxID=3383345 RepID=UPI003F90786A
MKGLFITFEGPDGSGKSTQIKKLAQYLTEMNIKYIQTREPGGTVISDKIRAILLDPEHQEMINETEVLLYAASRAQHVREKIMPALAEGKIVLCDRFVDASVAYQGYGLGISIDQVKAINEFATGGLVPDRSYMIDLPVEESRRRLIARQGQEFSVDLDRIEQKKQSYHEAVRQGFHEIYNKEQSRICLVDGNQSIDSLFSLIKSDFTLLFRKHNQ